MSRYRKYIEIIDKLDKALEEQGMRLLEGKVTPENLAFMEKLLCVMDKAWVVAWQVDRLDDIARATGKLAQKGQGPDEETLAALSGERGGSGQGRDFRGGRDDSGFEARAVGGHTAGLWPEEGGDSPLSRRGRRAYDMDADAEESRRGRRSGAARAARRSSLDMRDTMDMEDGAERGFVMLPGLGVPPWYAARMGYGVDPYTHEDNAPYNDNGNGNAEANGGSGNNGARTRGGLVHAPVQSAAGGNGGTQTANA